MTTFVLEHSDGRIELGSRTLVFAFDDTGQEEFKDSKYPIYGIGGCAFLVEDYQRLVEIPFNNLCNKFFPLITRPWHIMAGLAGYRLKRGEKEIDIELSLMPKKSSTPALEIAD